MKVVILNPPKLFNPYETYLLVGTPSYKQHGKIDNISNLIIGQTLKNNGYDVVHIDAYNENLTIEQTRDRLLKEIPFNWLVVNTETHLDYDTPLSSFENITTCLSKPFLKSLKTRSVLFGTHSMFEKPPIWFNFNVAGEGETAVPNLILQFDNGIQIKKFQTASPVNQNKLVVPNVESFKYTNSMDSLYFFDNGGKTIQMLTYRDSFSNNRNTFNPNNNYNDRYKYEREIIDQLNIIHDMGGKCVILDEINFDWVNLNLLHKNLKDLDLYFAGKINPKHLQNKKQVLKLHDIGYRTIELDVLSYNDPIHKNINSPLTKTVINKAINNCNREGIELVVNLLLFLPGEREQTLKNNQKFIENNNFFGNSSYICMVYPTSMLAKEFRIGGMIPSIESAGLVSTPWKTMNTIRKRWRDFDAEYNSPSIIEMLKHNQPEAFMNWRNGINLFE